MRRNAIPPPIPMAHLKIKPINKFGSVIGMHPMAVLIPVPFLQVGSLAFGLPGAIHEPIFPLQEAALENLAQKDGSGK